VHDSKQAVAFLWEVIEGLRAQLGCRLSAGPRCRHVSAKRQKRDRRRFAYAGSAPIGPTRQI